MSTLWVWFYWGIAWRKKVRSVAFFFLNVMFLCVSECFVMWSSSCENGSASSSSSNEQNRPTFEVSVNSQTTENKKTDGTLLHDLTLPFCLHSRTWIIIPYLHFPPATVRLPLGFLMKTSTFELGWTQKTTKRPKPGEKGRWAHGSDTVRGSRGVGTCLDDRVRAMKEFPR